MDADSELRPGQPHWTLPVEAGRLCPYCRSPLHDHEQVIVCPSCHIPHHLECWVDNGRCTTYGCPEVAALGLRRYLLRPAPEGGALEVRLEPEPTPPPAFDYAFYRLTLWFSLIALVGNLLLLVVHGLPMAVTGQPFSLLFGLLSLAMALQLRQYLRSEPGQALGAPERRRMSVAVRAGIGLALGQFALNACLTWLALLGPAQ